MLNIETFRLAKVSHQSSENAGFNIQGGGKAEDGEVRALR
jgi:hypothetical protein